MNNNKNKSRKKKNLETLEAILHVTYKASYALKKHVAIRNFIF